MNAVGTNTAISTAEIAMIGLVTSLIACFAASIGDETARDVALDVLDDDDRVVDDDADREHEAEQRQRVQREAEQMHGGERADERHGHGRERNDRRAPRAAGTAATTSTTSSSASNERLHDGVDRLAHEHRRVVDDAVVDALREVLRELRHLGAHLVRDLDRVAAAGPLIDRDRDGLLVVEQRAQRVGARAELDARDVLQARDLAAFAGLDDDVLELFLGDEAALRVDEQLELVPRSAPAARRAGRLRPARSARGSRARRRSP